MNEQPKFTPGPWKAHNDIVTADIPRGEYRTTAVAYTGDEWRHLGGLCYGDEEDANARLIAAAPEMYEALRSMVAGFKPFTFRPVGAPGSPAREEQDEQNRAHAAARAALAKVEGRG